jgi:hypothetical protein
MSRARVSSSKSRARAISLTPIRISRSGPWGDSLHLPHCPRAPGGLHAEVCCAAPGNGNRGHEGPAFGTELGAADKAALLEYLKTF